MAFTDLIGRLDARPGVRGRQFERICAWYLRNAPEYSGKLAKVWLWKDWPDAWGDEAGIDLVAEARDGGLWAIQAKAYDQTYWIKKSDVDSFLSEAARPDFVYRLLIATTDNLGRLAKRTIVAQREPVGYLLRSDLELAPVVWPTSLDDLRPRRPERRKPFSHVKEAIRATTKGFKGTDRGQLIMACGTGKTLAAMWIAEQLGSKRTLILVPSLSLVKQTLREWSANATEPFDYLAVCSDETVVGEDRFVQHTAELGLPVTTDPERIAAFLRRRGRRVVFATYQSSSQIARAFSGRTPRFDLAVADEAHRCAGLVGSEFTTILDRDQIRAKRRLFMTATPRVYTRRVRDEAGMQDVEVVSMDDKAAFGPVLHQLTFGEGIQRDLLSDYQVVVVGVDDETYRSYAEKGKFVTRDGEKANARILAGQIYFWEYLRDTYGPTQAVAVRRQADTHRDSASLGTLLSEIAADSELITRAFWIGLWNVRNDPINSAIVARQWHHAFGGDVGEHLDPAIPAGDCDRLAAAAAAVKRYVDENVAHSDMSPAKVEATFNDIHGAIDTISGLFTTYAALLTAKGWAGLTPVIQGDWEVIFREPWIREG